MKNGPLFLVGLFAALLISWGGVVLGSHAQLGALTAYFDDAEGQAYPQRVAGLAARGQLVYTDLGCAACHTQQVRRPDFGSDQARGWGERQSVARDYVYQARPQLGDSRFGPDLANLAARKPTEENLYALLYGGTQTHPSYSFLFETREIVGEPSSKAVKTGSPLPPRTEVVPTERAQTLVAYLLSLNQSYVYPESRPVAPEKKAEHAGPAPEHLEVKPIPAAAPDAAKKESKK
jgi:cytochrome c oxidase cbb3-type subunit 2